MPIADLKYIRVYRASFYLFALFSIVIGVWPGPVEIIDVEYQDKILHFFYYFFAATYFYQFLTLRRACSLLFLVGVTVEFTQALLPYRYADILDVVANSFGLMVGILLKRFFTYLHFIEQKFLVP